MVANRLVLALLALTAAPAVLLAFTANRRWRFLVLRCARESASPEAPSPEALGPQAMPAITPPP